MPGVLLRRVLRRRAVKFTAFGAKNYLIAYGFSLVTDCASSVIPFLFLLYL